MAVNGKAPIKLPPRFLKKCRQITRSTVNFTLNYSDFDYFISKQRKWQHRLLGYLIIVTVSCVCFYQMRDRVSFYLSEPVAMDVAIVQPTSIKIPVLKACSEESPYLLSKVGKLSDYKCYNLLIFSLSNPDVNMSQVWNVDQNFSLVYDVSLTQISNESDLSLIQTVQKSVFGFCTSIKLSGLLAGNDINGVVRFKIAPSLICSSPFDMLQVADPLDYQYIMYIVVGYLNIIRGRIKKYTFLSLKKNQCEHEKKFIDCYNKCFYEKYRKNFNCRLPFIPSSEFSGPICQSSAEGQSIYLKTLKFATNLNQYKTCKCPRICQQYFYYRDVELVKSPSETTTFEYYGNVGEMLTYQQRRNYGVFDLIVDVAGILGLWLGFSLLSIVHILSCILMSVVTQHQLKQLTSKRSIPVTGLLDFIKKSISAQNDQIEKSIESTSCFRVAILNKIISLFLVVLAAGVVISRVQFYLAEPIRTIVEIEEFDQVQFPDITECATAAAIYFKCNKYSKELKQNMCTITMLDLLDKKIDVDTIWEKSLAKPQSLERNEIKEKFSNFEFDKMNYSFVDTPFGRCLRYSFEPMKYYGISTTYASIYYLPSSGICDTNSSQIYLNMPEDNPLSLTTRITTPKDATTAIALLTTKIVRVSSKRNPCIEKSLKYYECKERCLTNRVKQNLACSLPFTPELNASRCNSATSAKKAFDSYIKIHAQTNLQQDCLCNPLCVEITYNVRFFSYKAQFGTITSIIYTFTSGKVESVIQLFNYGAIALTCDIANSLGLAVGFSILNFLTLISKYSISFKVWLFQKLFKN